MNQSAAKKNSDNNNSEIGKRRADSNSEQAAVQLETNPLWHRVATHSEPSAAVAPDTLARPGKPHSNTASNTGSTVNLVGVLQCMPEEPDQTQLLETDQIQLKLSVGSPNDPYEQEADRASGAVIAGEKVAPVSRIASSVSRKPVVASNSAMASSSLESRISSPSGGRPLAGTMRREMESSFNTDFSAVRIYDSTNAQSDARDLGARAFTHKNRIWLGEGASANDRGLMAHELTHVVQQGGVIRRKPIDENQQEEAIQQENVDPENANDSQKSQFYTSEEPQVQAAWYNFDIPYTDYQFDPSIRGVKYAANLAKDTAVSAFDWVVDKIKGLVDTGIEWLNDQFEKIEEFASSAFKDVQTGLKTLLGFITAPISLVTSAIENMNPNLLSVAWNLLSVGARAVQTGMNSLIKGVLETGNGLWNTASKYVSGFFTKVNRIIDSWAFKQLPSIVQRNARKLILGVSNLWSKIKKFISDLMERLNKFVKGILDSIDSFLTNIVSKGIKRIIKTVRDIQEAWQFVKKIASDPEGYARPHINQATEKLNAEAPPKAVSLGEEKLQENFQVDASSGNEIVIQRQPAKSKANRSTASFSEVLQGFGDAISKAWSGLDIGDMLWQAVVNIFWPPATFRAIGHEFSELWHTDWANASDSLFMPRNIADDFGGFLHDVWSNILVLLDFPLALWRRLNAILMLLLGFVTLLLLFIGAIGGGVIGAGAGGAGAIPGALAGMGVALEIVAPAGLGLLASYFAAEGITVVKSFVDLFSARQTQTEKNRDYTQIAGSLIGMAAAAILVAILFLLSSFVSAVVGRIKGAPIKSKASSAKSAEPAKPTTEPVKPVEPAKPAKPTTDPVEPARPPVEPVKPPTKPVEPAKPSNKPVEPVDDLNPKTPKNEEPVKPAKGALKTFEVTDASALKATEPSMISGPKNQSIWHWELYVELPNGEIAVFCEVNIRPLISRGSPDLNLHPKTATVKGQTTPVELTKPPGSFGWTTESLKLVIESYKAKFGHAPKNLGGWLAKSNLKNFQAEFAKFRAQFPGKSNAQIADLAIRAISFGKNRIPLGYEHFHVTIFKMGKVKLPGGTTETVPTVVRVEAGTTPVNLSKLPPITAPKIEDDENDQEE